MNRKVLFLLMIITILWINLNAVSIDRRVTSYSLGDKTTGEFHVIKLTDADGNEEQWVKWDDAKKIINVSQTAYEEQKQTTIVLSIMIMILLFGIVLMPVIFDMKPRRKE